MTGQDENSPPQEFHVWCPLLDAYEANGHVVQAKNAAHAAKIWAADYDVNFSRKLEEGISGGDEYEVHVRDQAGAVEAFLVYATVKLRYFADPVRAKDETPHGAATPKTERLLHGFETLQEISECCKKHDLTFKLRYRQGHWHVGLEDNYDGETFGQTDESLAVAISRAFESFLRYAMTT